mmetsp:Transcript_18139/g.54205  ORF Transcript_18139/g.54205 Transcript_18139/m.54205 type:complete len:302 (+) Transcript_18139:1988-2893(+)
MLLPQEPLRHARPLDGGLRGLLALAVLLVLAVDLLRRLAVQIDLKGPAPDDEELVAHLTSARDHRAFGHLEAGGHGGDVRKCVLARLQERPKIHVPGHRVADKFHLLLRVLLLQLHGGLLVVERSPSAVLRVVNRPALWKTQPPLQWRLFKGRSGHRQRDQGLRSVAREDGSDVRPLGQQRVAAEIIASAKGRAGFLAFLRGALGDHQRLTRLDEVECSAGFALAYEALPWLPRPTRQMLCHLRQLRAGQLLAEQGHRRQEKYSPLKVCPVLLVVDRLAQQTTQSMQAAANHGSERGAEPT